MIRREFRQLEHNHKKEALINTNEKPSCFSDRDWEEWLDLSTCCSSSVNRTDVCRDCTPAFKERMMINSKCDHVNVKFLTTEKNFTDILDLPTAETYGKRPRAKRVMQ